MDELAFGITGENVHYGTPTNPIAPSHIPGGSSSGSVVAVATKLVDFAIGTDTLGCVRTPAAFCGILGSRPLHGALSSIGVLPNAQSLDTIVCQDCLLCMWMVERKSNNNGPRWCLASLTLQRSFMVGIKGTRVKLEESLDGTRVVLQLIIK